MKVKPGAVPRRDGEVRFQGDNIIAAPTHRRFSLGLAYVPEERRIVSGLTVQENLRLGLVAAPNRACQSEVIDRIAATFPSPEPPVERSDLANRPAAVRQDRSHKTALTCT